MKLLVADDHALFRDGLSLHLEKLAPQAIIYQAANFSQAIKILQSMTDIDLVIIDLDMPDMDWEEGLKTIRETSPESKIVIISASENPQHIKKSLNIGVKGYISKSSDTKVLTSALNLILDGGTYLPPSLMEIASHGVGIKEDNKKMLTPRQSEVLRYVAEGLSNKQIAYKMNVSEATVKLHINALLRSLNATNRTQALIIAQKRGII